MVSLSTAPWSYSDALVQQETRRPIFLRGNGTCQFQCFWFITMEQGVLREPFGFFRLSLLTTLQTQHVSARMAEEIMWQQFKIIQESSSDRRWTIMRSLAFNLVRFFLLNKLMTKPMSSVLSPWSKLPVLLSERARRAPSATTQTFLVAFTCNPHLSFRRYGCDCRCLRGSLARLQTKYAKTPGSES